MTILKVPPIPSVGRTNQLVFILGNSLGHSLSPAMHNAAFRALRIPWVYTPLEISKAEVKTAIEILRMPNVHGSNVTVPYKEDVLPSLDNLEEKTRWLGSVNTIYRRGDKLWGTSTDGEGFLRSLGSLRKRIKGSKLLLIGAGGAAKALAGALAESGAKRIFIANRSPKRAKELVKSILKKYPRLESGFISMKEAGKILSQCDGVVQATSIGLKIDDPPPISLAHLRPSTLAVELIYHRETAFLKEVRLRRAHCLGGLGMLLHQGALSFEYWTGHKAPLVLMRKTLLDRLAHQ